MKKSIINELFEGEHNINSIPLSEKCMDLFMKLNKQLKKIKDLMQNNSTALKNFENYLTILLDYLKEYGKSSYLQGFKVGLKLGIEVLQENEIDDLI